MAKKKATPTKNRIVYPTPVEHLKHRDKRVNIPTEELRDFVAEDENAPKKMIYPRDPSLDPQLVWKGKDEQDSKPLEVPVVPIYIQEKIHPQAIIEDVRAQARKEKPEDQFGLFADFNGIKFEEMIDFYQHEQNWANRAILGDSLLVMTSLSEKEGLKGKVQSIYLDPPYGIKFGSNWQVSTRKRDVKDGKVEDATRQPEQVKAFRDTWKLGIHSYLAYLRDRFVVCRDLLTESGSLFVQIGDENVHLVRSLLDEVFGSENFCSQVAFRTATSQPTNLISCVYDFVLWYGKVRSEVKYRTLNREREYFEKIGTFGWIELQNGEERTLNAKEKRGELPLPEGGKLLKDADVTVTRKPDEPYQHPWFKGRGFPLSSELQYMAGLERLIADDRVIIINERLCGKRYESDNPYVKFNSIWDDTTQGTFELTKDPKRYVVQTAPKVIQRCLLMTTDPGDLVLDPTCVRKGTRILTPYSPPQAGDDDSVFLQAGSANPPSPLAGRAGVGLKNIEHIKRDDYVFAHDGKPHRVLRVLARKYSGKMIGLRHERSHELLWLTADHLVLANRRVNALSDEGEWSSASKHHFERARELRKDMSPPERILWSRLRDKQLGVKFRRQHPIGPYIPDFYTRDAGIIVEVDGSQHVETNGAMEYDRQRDEYLQALGLRVLRFTASEVSKNLSGVLESIYEATREQVLPDDHTKQFRYAGNLAVGDMVFVGTDLDACSIVEIEQEETVEEVYDLEVEEAHSFLTEVCAVHNCGSGTTAYVAEQWGRRWITIDTSRVALALARTRLMAAKFPYYILADSAEGIKKEAEVTGNVSPLLTGEGPGVRSEHDIKKGFVSKRVPHITLKSIANNEEIDAIHAKWQEKLEPIRKELNKSLNKHWEEWEIPRPDVILTPNEVSGKNLPKGEKRDSSVASLPQNDKWSESAKSLLEESWSLRRQRQKEIDDSIARHADTELLYDQPYEDRKRIRVTGPFTVESLSPHRVLAPADENLDGTVSEKPARQRSGGEAKQQQDFVSMILENLRKAGVQNTIKKERLKFDRLEPFAGVWLHAQGEYSENGKRKRVAVSIGPEHGTVGPQFVKEAAKEAVQGVGFDLLIVCGFAFDPHVSEEVRRYGKLTVQTARMNPDLAMGDELLKKTGSGNLFMVFGEPDIDVKKKDGKIVVTLKGLDVYDPTTGQIRSSSTDDIACWFIDTNYNGESFFVRHAYFTGADEPYEKLKRALRAEIDEAAWSALCSTKSRAFDPPKTGKIAVKVINHYGDEVLKVFEVK